jgi:hypothetical protein
LGAANGNAADASVQEFCEWGFTTIFNGAKNIYHELIVIIICHQDLHDTLDLECAFPIGGHWVQTVEVFTWYVTHMAAISWA